MATHGISDFCWHFPSGYSHQCQTVFSFYFPRCRLVFHSTGFGNFPEIPMVPSQKLFELHHGTGFCLGVLDNSAEIFHFLSQTPPFLPSHLHFQALQKRQS